MTIQDELSRFSVGRFRDQGFQGRGNTLRMVGPDLQWVAAVEKVSHVDQVNIEIGLAFRASPPAKRNDCRVLWSLANFVDVESAEVARALVPAADDTVDERKEKIGAAIDVAAGFVRAHDSLALLKDAYRQGRLDKAFLFKDARELLEGP